MASIIDRNRNLYAQFYDADRTPKRKQISLRTSRKKIARRLLIKLKDAYALGEFDPWTQNLDAFFDRKNEPRTIQEALDRFLEAKREADRSENTINSYRWLVGLFTKRIGPDTQLSRLKPQHIKTFVRDRSVSQSTRRTRFWHVRAFLRWATKEAHRRSSDRRRRAA